MSFDYLPRRKSFVHRLICGFVAVSFLFTSILPPRVAHAQATAQFLNLPAPGVMVPPSIGFQPAQIKGITIHPENPLQFDFLIDQGDQTLEGQEAYTESKKLIKYFLASLTVPEQDMWVNLSPYEKDRIIPESFGATRMGRDLLAQDYILKQLTASLMYPEKELGDKFWTKVRQKAQEKFGTAEIPMNTFNKVWIIPEKAVVFVSGNTAYVVESHLKVMLEEDYVAMSHQKDIDADSRHPEGVSPKDLNLDSSPSAQNDDKNDKETNKLTSEIIQDIIIPEIEKEVNEGENFAQLRQIYSSTILAAWFKKNLKESLLGQVYVDQNKTKGVEIEDKSDNQKIYDRYVEAFKTGVYNYIKEDFDSATQEVIPRKYFSGGTALAVEERLEETTDVTRLSRAAQEALARSQSSTILQATANLAELSSGANEEDVDAVLELAHSTEAETDWIKAKTFKSSDVGHDQQARNAVDRAFNFFLALEEDAGFRKDSNLEGGDILSFYLRGLLDQSLPVNDFGKAPEINFVTVDEDRFLAATGGVNVLGHASDRGINLRNWSALIHELGAFLGLSHVENVALETVVFNYNGAFQAHPSIVINSTQINEKFVQRLKAEGFDPEVEGNLSRNFSLALEKVRALGKDRSPRLLTGMKSIGAGRDFAAGQENYDVNIAKMKGNIPHDGPDSINEAIRRAFVRGRVDSMPVEMVERFRAYLTDANVQEYLSGFSLTAQDLRALLDDGEAPVKFWLARDIKDNSPALLVTASGDYQIAHIGLSSNYIYLAAGMAKDLDKKQAEKDQKPLLNVLMLRELFILAKVKQLIEEGTDRDAAALIAEDEADILEKAIVGNGLDAEVDAKISDFREVQKNKIKLGIKFSIGELASKYGIPVARPHTIRLSEMIPDLVKGLLTKSGNIQQDAILDFFKLLNSNRRILRVLYANRPEVLQSFSWLTRSGYYHNDYMTPFPVEMMIGVKYFEVYEAGRIEAAKDSLLKNETLVNNFESLDHQELFASINTAIDGIFEGYVLHDDTQYVLRAEFQKRLWRDVARTAQLKSRNARPHFTDARDYDQSNFQTAAKGRDRALIMSHVIDMRSLARGVETAGGATTQVALLKNRHGEEIEDPFHNIKQQMGVLKEKLINIIGQRIDPKSKDGEALYDRYEAKYDRKILSLEELTSLLERNGISADSDTGKEAIRIYSIKQEALFRGFYAVALNKMPPVFVEKVVREFYKSGVDVFRIFTADNDIREINAVIDMVHTLGSGFVQPVIHYTNNFSGGNARFVELAKSLIERSTQNGKNILDALVIKDAPGILTPEAAYSLVKALRAEFQNIPIQIHTHTTSGYSELVLAEAIRANGDQGELVVDVSLGPEPFAQPRFRSMRSLLDGTSWASAFGVEEESLTQAEFGVASVVRESYPQLDDYDVTIKRKVVEAGLPGGMFTNFVTIDIDPNLRSYRNEFSNKDGLGIQILNNMENKNSPYSEAGKRFKRAFLIAVLDEMIAVTRDFGHISRVTPYSQWIGVQAYNNVLNSIRQGWVKMGKDDDGNAILVRNDKFPQQAVDRYFLTGARGEKILQMSVEMQNILFVWAQDGFLQWLYPETNPELVLAVYEGVLRKDLPSNEANIFLGRLQQALASLTQPQDEPRTTVDPRIQEILQPYAPMAQAINPRTAKNTIVDMRAVKYTRLYQEKYGNGIPTATGLQVVEGEGRKVPVPSYDRARILEFKGEKFLSIALTEEEFEARSRDWQAKYPGILPTESDKILAYMYGQPALDLFQLRDTWRQRLRAETDELQKEKIRDILRKMGVPQSFYEGEMRPETQSDSVVAQTQQKREPQILSADVLRDPQSVEEGIAWKKRNEYMFGGGFGYDIRMNDAQSEWEDAVKLAYAEGRTMGGSLYLNHQGRALVTGDQRPTSDPLRMAWAQGLADEGIEVVTQADGEVITTGLASRKGLADNYDLVVQVTGSHNPYVGNGAKFIYKGLPFFANQLLDFSKAIEQKAGWSESVNEKPSIIKQRLIANHIDALARALPDLENPPSLIADFRGGAAGEVFIGVAEKKGYRVFRFDSAEAAIPDAIYETTTGPILIVLNDTPSPRMQAGIWDPSKPESFDGIKALQQRIYSNKRFKGRKFAGASFDGDGDRSGLMTEEGKLVMPERMLMSYYQRFVLANEDGIRALNKAGHTVILALDVRASKIIVDVLQSIAQNKGLNITGEFIAAGFPNHREFVIQELTKIESLLPEIIDAVEQEAVRKLMREYTSAEASGHFFFNVLSADQFYKKKTVVDDGIASAFIYMDLVGTLNNYELKGQEVSQPELTIKKTDEIFPWLPVTTEVRLENAPQDVLKKQALAEDILLRFAQDNPALFKLSFDELKRQVEAARTAPPKRQGMNDSLLLVDGIRVELTNGVWILFRKSNTSAVVTFKAEADSVIKQKELVETIQLLEKAILTVKDANPDYASVDVSKFKAELAFQDRRLAGQEFLASAGSRGRFETLFKDEGKERGGWVNRPWELSSEFIDFVETQNRQRRNVQGIKVLGFIGMGGEASIVGQSDKDLVNISSTSPLKIKRALRDFSSRGITLNQVMWYVTSKSGSTKETRNNSSYLEKVYTNAGLDPKQYIIYVTDPGTGLANEKQDAGFLVLPRERTGIETGPTDNVGGRNTLVNYSTLIAYSWRNPDKLQAMVDAIKNNHVFADSAANPWIVAAQQAASFIREGKKPKLAIIQPEKMRKDLWIWQQQNPEESLGKNDDAFTVYTTRPDLETLKTMKDNGWVFVEFQVKGSEEETKAYAQKAKKDGHPVLTIPINATEDEFASVVSQYGWMEFVAMLGGFWNVNFSDQPAVEAYKKLMREKNLTLNDALKPAAENKAILAFGRNQLVIDGILNQLSATDRSEVESLIAQNESAAKIFATILSKTSSLDALTLAYYDDADQKTENWIEDLTQRILHKKLGYAAKWGEGTGVLHGLFVNWFSGPKHQIPVQIVASQHEQPSEDYEAGGKILQEGAVAAHLSLLQANRPSVMIVTPGQLTGKEQLEISRFFNEVAGYYSRLSGEKLSASNKPSENKRGVNEAAFPRYQVFENRVVAVQGWGNIGQELSDPLLNAAEVVVISETNPNNVVTLRAKYADEIRDKKVVVIQEDKLPFEQFIDEYALGIMKKDATLTKENTIVLTIKGDTNLQTIIDRVNQNPTSNFLVFIATGLEKDDDWVEYFRSALGETIKGKLIIRKESDYTPRFTKKVMDPRQYMKEAGLTKSSVDLHILAAFGGQIDDQAVVDLAASGTKAVVVSTNNVLVDIQRHSQALKTAGIVTLADFASNFGGAVGVSGHIIGVDNSDKAVRDLAAANAFHDMEEALRRDMTTQQVAEERAAQFFAQAIVGEGRLVQKFFPEESQREIESIREAIESGQSDMDLVIKNDVNGNIQNPKRLDGYRLPDGTTIKVYAYKEDLPPEAQGHWKDHYAVFEFRNPQKIGETAIYVSIHKATKISSLVDVLDGKYKASGGTRMLRDQYSKDVDALVDALTLSFEMTDKFTAANVPIGGSKSAIRAVGFDPSPLGQDQQKRQAVLEIYGNALSFLENYAVSVFTGQDMNIAVKDAEYLKTRAPLSISPNPDVQRDAEGNVLTRAPSPPTAVGVYTAAAAALEFSLKKRQSQEAPQPKFGHSGNKVDAKFVEAKAAIEEREYSKARDLVLEAVRLLRETPFDEMDSSGFPVADTINQAEVAEWVIRALAYNYGYEDSDLWAMLNEFAIGKKVGFDLKVALGYRPQPQDREAAQAAAATVDVDTAQAEPNSGAGTKGGIDLNPLHLNLQIKTDGNGVPLPINLQPIDPSLMNIQGFVPVIIDVKPVNLPLILGIKYDGEGNIYFSEKENIPAEEYSEDKIVLELSSAIKE